MYEYNLHRLIKYIICDEKKSQFLLLKDVLKRKTIISSIRENIYRMNAQYCLDSVAIRMK